MQRDQNYYFGHNILHKKIIYEKKKKKKVLDMEGKETNIFFPYFEFYFISYQF